MLLCPDLKCLCTTDNEDLYRGCINCIVAVKPNRTVIAQGQNTVEQFAANCNQNGVPIPIQTVSGFTGVVGTPTSSVSGTRLLSTSVARFSTTNLHTTSPTGLMTPLPSGSGSVAASGGSVSESVGSTSLTAPLSVPTGPGILSTSGISSGSDLSTSSGSSTASGPSTSATSPTQSQNGGTSVFKKGSFDVANLPPSSTEYVPQNQELGSTLLVYFCNISGRRLLPQTPLLDGPDRDQAQDGHRNGEDTDTGFVVFIWWHESSSADPKRFLASIDIKDLVFPQGYSRKFVSLSGAVARTINSQQEDHPPSSSQLFGVYTTFFTYNLPASSGNDLVVRQAPSSSSLDPSQFPSQCQSSCTTIINSLNGCTTDSCICTSDNASGMSSCVNCLVNIAPDSDSLKSEGQNLLDQFNAECASFNLPSLAVGSTPSASSGGSATPTGSHSLAASSPTSSKNATASGGQSGLIGNSALDMSGGLAGLVVSLGIVFVAAYIL
ncbi:hypothetical protein D9758_004366 [Tetrapyrgos nigripes]|uniref:Uncharacterized protein n=1 Tax=Tetrapyrgos nigripes TaxID=182062 RepID=A0A8H5GN94_9AGAR|nr:hypothetical protein D9758_004366 [Tetrapyrgos nigripes]